MVNSLCKSAAEDCAYDWKQKELVIIIIINNLTILIFILSLFERIAIPSYFFVINLRAFATSSGDTALALLLKFCLTYVTISAIVSSGKRFRLGILLLYVFPFT